MVEVNWTGIARSAKALGGQGTNLLLLKTKGGYAGDVLDAATPTGDETPDNGRWFPTPKGWMLMIEGHDEEVNPWIEQLASALGEAGIEGSLTGGPAVRWPTWAEQVDLPFPSLNGLLAFRPEDRAEPFGIWDTAPEALGAAIDTSVAWLAAHDGDLMAVANLRANFWVDAATAAQILHAQASQHHVAAARSFSEERTEVRSATTEGGGLLTLTSSARNVPWTETTGELRQLLLQLPLDQLCVAAVSHRDWTTLLSTKVSGSDYYDRHTYYQHPERWDEFTLDPCGIQILTDRHLAHAHDLSHWRTTRLDATHHLVEARDLEPWYATPRTQEQTIDPDTLAQARRDFGDIVLTHHQAEELGLTTKATGTG